MMDQCNFFQSSFGKYHSLARNQWSGVYVWGVLYACPPTPPSPLPTTTSTPICQPLSHYLSSPSAKLPLSPSRLVGAVFSLFRWKTFNAAAAVTTNNNITSMNDANLQNYNSNSNISSPTSITCCLDTHWYDGSYLICIYINMISKQTCIGMHHL